MSKRAYIRFCLTAGEQAYRRQVSEVQAVMELWLSLTADDRQEVMKGYRQVVSERSPRGHNSAQAAA